jgi:hypothetical protein
MSAAQANSYTVILLYPLSFTDGDVQSYINVAIAETPLQAAQMVQSMASDENEGLVEPEDFQVIAVLKGDLPVELNERDFA